MNSDGKSMVAQGDVLLIPFRGDVPANATREPVDERHGVVLAYGEATGSAHALDAHTAQVLTEPSLSLRLLLVGDAPAVLRHVKHPPITLPAKTVWQVVRQVEEVEGVAFRVAD